MKENAAFKGIGEEVEITGAFRTDVDFLGSRKIPATAMYGIQTKRAKENFPLTGRCLYDYPSLIKSLALVKKACAIANQQCGDLANDTCFQIVSACDSIIAGKKHEEFVVDMIQGGAGTSSNMNMNEVLANMVADELGQPLGRYQSCHPNNHVNLSQSTNDVYPTAIRIALLLDWQLFEKELKGLIKAFREKSEDLASDVKLGRTQLQDAVPMTFGNEFNAFANLLEDQIESLVKAKQSLFSVNLGGTAIGSGINANEEFAPLAIKILAQECHFQLTQSADLFAASYDVGPLVSVSSELRNLSLKLSKIANDLRLLSMGPRGGIAEINLPPVQPGSSIMPGKVNPVIPEAVSQVAYQIIGFDHANSMAAESGQLQLNAMEPLIAFNLLESIKLLTNTFSMFANKCISGITVNKKRSFSLLQDSVALATAMVPYIGYENASRLAKESLSTGLPVAELAVNESLVSKQQLTELMSRFIQDD